MTHNDRYVVYGNPYQKIVPKVLLIYITTTNIITLLVFRQQEILLIRWITKKN